MAMRGGEVFPIALLGVCMCASLVGADLTFGYYDKTCPNAESIVFDEVTKAFRAINGFAAGLIRLHFHDCFVNGCDGSVLIDSANGNKAEKDAPPNLSLRGFDVIDNAKTRIEETKGCKETVSCADILAFAARDSFYLTGGYRYAVPAGRRDGIVSRAADTGDLPPPNLNLDQLTKFFAKKQLSQEDLVVLSGAHTLGIAHCGTFGSRLNNMQDSTMDSSYRDELRQKCGGNPSQEVPMDPRSPNTFDSSYYNNTLNKRGLFESDMALLASDQTAKQVQDLANDVNGFKKKYEAAITKMGQIGVITGNYGQIRVNCRRVN